MQVCSVNKPDDYDVNDNITEKIYKLKSNGNNFSIENFNLLINTVNRLTIIDNNVNNIDINVKTKLQNIINAINDKENHIFSNSPKFIHYLLLTNMN